VARGAELERHGVRWRAVALAIVLGVATRPSGARATGTEPTATVTPPETFSVTYTVEIARPDATSALVRWDLAGIDEVKRLRLRFDPARFEDFEASGTLERRHGEVVWTPGAPYAHLTYRASLQHRRAPGKGYDAWIGDGWMLARTSALFPRSAVLFRTDVEAHPKSRARLVFRLPKTWEVVTVMPSVGPREFIVESGGRFDHPRGWLMCGRFRRTPATVDDTSVTIAATPNAAMTPDRVLGLLERAMPVMHALLGRVRPELLIVTGVDPMWRGGLSGEDSFYMHGDRPLQTPDRTSPYLHELFHVIAPFRPAPDAHWVTEGLAELYTIEIQKRVGLLDDDGYAKALRLFARYGLWGHDLTRDQRNAIHNNSAPLVLHALDRRIRHATGGAQGLDDVVAALARDGGVVTTARFLGTVRRVTGHNFGAFFRRHVYRGERPPLPDMRGPGAPRESHEPHDSHDSMEAAPDGGEPGEPDDVP
jgi:hypothetical protein